MRRKKIGIWQAEEALKLAHRFAQDVPQCHIDHDDVAMDILERWLKLKPASKYLAYGIARNVVKEHQRAYYRELNMQRLHEVVGQDDEGNEQTFEDVIPDLSDVLVESWRGAQKGIGKLRLPPLAAAAARKIAQGHRKRVTEKEQKALDKFRANWLTKHPVYAKMWGLA